MALSSKGADVHASTCGDQGVAAAAAAASLRKLRNQARRDRRKRLLSRLTIQRDSLLCLWSSGEMNGVGIGPVQPTFDQPCSEMGVIERLANVEVVLLNLLQGPQAALGRY